MILISLKISYPDAIVHIDERPNNKIQISIEPKNNSIFILRKCCETSYPLDLIKLILKIKGPSYLCDEIMRDEDPSYVQLCLNNSILGYIDKSSFDNKRILDFGCGSGASTFILSRMFPKTEIIGVELDEQLLSIADLILKQYNLKNIKFILSPSGDKLPEKIGKFDFIILSAVFEHILPNERRKILEQLWLTLNQNGILFINQTPNRYSPIETHTTGFPFINYLPDDMVLKLTRRFSKRIKKDVTWESLLRYGIRGTTAKEIMDILGELFPDEQILLNPTRLGFKDDIDIWYANHGYNTMLTKIIKFISKCIKSISGHTFLHTVTLAIKKHNSIGII